VSSSPNFPLALVTDVGLPGGSTRFDYQEVDSSHGHLVVAHMNDASVLVLNLADGSVAKLLPNIPTPRGVAVGDGRIFVTSSPSHVVIIDGVGLAEIARVPTGTAPDGVGYDPVDHVVGVSDQQDGATSLIPDKGNGQRTQVSLGKETGNVIFDAGRGIFWAAVVNTSPPDQLVQIDPVTKKVTTRIDLPGCEGAHGVRLHPDGQSAFVACEDNNLLVRVDLGGAHALSSSPTGGGPDVMGVDPGLGWLYVASESGDLVIFDIGKPGLVAIDHEHPGDNAHSVAVDPATHRVFFPLMAGPNGKPVLRIMIPKLGPSPAGSRTAQPVPAPQPLHSVTGSVAAPPTTADASPASGARAWSFDGDPAGQPPDGFAFGRTGNGKEGVWVVRSEPGAPSGGNVLAQTDADPTDYRFPLAWVKELSLADVDARVRCKPLSGRVDEACGLVFRLRDADNYYLTRANALEGNVRLYFVKNGHREQIATYAGKVTAGAWHELRATAVGDRLEVYWDATKVIEKRDKTFSDAGSVGMWTKADSITEFDDLTVQPM
jgi:YVTN family beta-propeller protein